MELLQKREEANDSSIKNLLTESLGPTCRKEVDWLCDCFSSGMRYYREVEAQKIDLRMPVTLAEPTFMGELRKGKALRALRRIFMMCRIQRIFEDCLDEILSGKWVVLFEADCFALPLIVWILSFEPTYFLKNSAMKNSVNEDVKQVLYQPWILI